MSAKTLSCIIILGELLIGQSDIYAPGQVLIRAKRNVIRLPSGIQKGGLEVMEDSVIRRFLLNHNFIEIERAIPDFSSSETLTTLENGEVIKVPDFSLVYLLHFPDTTDIIPLCETLRTFSGVEWAHPNLLLSTYVNPNDPRFSEQWA
ncbi:MAG: hypothetical protein ACPL28_12390, partial [bacterium]